MKTVQWVSSRECPLWVDTKEGVGLCNHPDKATEDPPFCGADYCQQCKLSPLNTKVKGQRNSKKE